jgi:hypothetical protein
MLDTFGVFQLLLKIGFLMLCVAFHVELVDLLPYECRIASKFCCCVLQLAYNNLGLKEGMLV